MLSVTATPFGFKSPRYVGDSIDVDCLQLNVTGGYDHTWVLNTQGDDTRLAARITDDASGRTVEVYTTEPGLQIYTANGLKGNITGKKQTVYGKRCSICFETQHFADSPNKPQFRQQFFVRVNDTESHRLSLRRYSINRFIDTFYSREFLSFLTSFR
ncbi:MAG: hypothetical protein R2738_02750 [Bacteroides graminisolvens]